MRCRGRRPRRKETPMYEHDEHPGLDPYWEGHWGPEDEDDAGTYDVAEDSALEYSLFGDC